MGSSSGEAWPTALADKIEQLERRVAVLEKAIAKYVNCRHACVDCPCTREARAALGDSPRKGE